MKTATIHALRNHWCGTDEKITALEIAEELGGKSKRVIFVTGRKSPEMIKTLSNDPQFNSIEVEVISYQSLNKINMKQYVDVWIIDHPREDSTANQLRELIGKYASVIFVSDANICEKIRKIILPCE